MPRKSPRDTKPDYLEILEQMNTRDVRVLYAGQSQRVNPEDPEGTQARQEAGLRSLSPEHFASLSTLVQKLNRENTGG